MVQVPVSKHNSFLRCIYNGIDVNRPRSNRKLLKMHQSSAHSVCFISESKDPKPPLPVGLVVAEVDVDGAVVLPVRPDKLPGGSVWVVLA